MLCLRIASSEDLCLMIEMVFAQRAGGGAGRGAALQMSGFGSESLVFPPACFYVTRGERRASGSQS